MCGITGIVRFDAQPVAVDTLVRMTRALSHRGPDDEGVMIDGSVGLGHRRLAIIDLSERAHQPMSTADRRFTISYAGEIYNYLELRAELHELGCIFHSDSDTEVLLQALATWGDACLPRLNGMFCFALWDHTRQVLWLARDRYGIKPLYMAQIPGAAVFGTEIKAILAHPAVQARLDLEGLVEYFTFQNFLTDRTLFEGIKTVPPGCCIAMDVRRQRIDVTRYWDFDFRHPAHGQDAQEYVEELDRLFRSAVNRQLVGDVEIGAYLSGGTDSGSITAVASRSHPFLKSFTAGFEEISASGLELGFSDERAEAEYLSYLFRTEHYEIVLKAGDMERVMRDVVWHLEEPRVGQSYPNFYTAKLASKFVKVVLSGTGGDELFAGYPWRYYRAVVNDSFDNYIDKYYRFWQRLIPQERVRDFFAPIWHQVSEVDTRDIFRGVFANPASSLSTPEDYVAHSLYFEAKTFLHGLLIVEDKLSMAHGLETRVPFLDNDLVDFAMRMPVRFKLGNLDRIVRLDENEPGPKTQKYFERTRDGKLILRACMERYVPREIAHGVKRGFSGPDASWFRGQSIDYVRRLLLDPAGRLYEFLDRRTVHQLVEEHLSGAVNRRLLIWSLLNFELWCQLFLA
jgi:asparagine synthase (glutamine-hydrolysing)